MLFFLMADAYRKKGNGKAAVEYYEEALEYTKSAEIYRGYVLALVEEEKYESARRLLRKAELGKEEEQLLLAQILYAQGEYQEAAEMAEGLENSENREVLEKIWELQLVCYKELGEEKKAESCYEKLEELKEKQTEGTEER